MPRYNIEDIRFGIHGANLSRALDMLDPSDASRLTNLQHVGGGQLLTRPGLTQIGKTTGLSIHSIGRLNAQVGAIPFARLYGIDASLFIGQSDNIQLVESGFSGNPLTFTPARPPLSDESWMLVGDKTKNRKIRIDGLSLSIGLPAPTAAPSTVAAPALNTAIDDFEGGYTMYAGIVDGAGSGGIPTPSYPPGQVGNALNIATNKGSSTTAYVNYADKGVGPLNLTLLPGGVVSTDDDLVHLWLKLDDPTHVDEIRLYLISGPFTTGSNFTPGTSATANTNAFLKAFRPNDLQSAIEQATIFVPTAETKRAVQSALSTSTKEDVKSIQVRVGRGVWTEIGTLDRPLRKADFTQIGTPNWNDIRGIAVWIQVQANKQVNLTIDNLFITGGFGLDSTVPGTAGYDWRSTNYDPRTGAESNPSPVAASTLKVLRTAVDVTPQAAGNSALRQRIWRRGGAVVDDWHLVGITTGDGVVFRDTISDSDAVGAITVQIDHFQPVPTVDATGATILAQPVSAFFGPARGFWFACGDPQRPGFLYWSKSGEPDHWPQTNVEEVTTGTERLVNGLVFGGQAYVCSTQRVYAIYQNLSGFGNTAVPTGIVIGLVSRRGIAVGLDAFYLVSFDGIYPVNGAVAARPVSDPIRGLFHGQTINGYAPIDFTVPESIALDYFDHELWFTFQDTTGAQVWWVYSLLYRYWRFHTFTPTVRSAHAEEGTTALSLLLGGSTGTVYQLGGTTDNGTAIQWQVRTGQLDQGRPREDKRYGNVALDIDPQGGTPRVTVYLDNAQTAQAVQTLAASTGRTRYYLDPFSGDIRARNVGLDVSGSGPATLYLGAVSYLVEPADYIRWESALVDHGIPTWQIPIRMDVAIRSIDTVTLTRRAYNQLGAVLLEDTYSIPTTGDQKIRRFIPFKAIKGTIFSYTFTSPSRFRIYEDETIILVQPWNGGQLVWAKVVGTDSDMRAGVNPLLAAIRAGGTL